MIRLENISKRFDQCVALNQVTLAMQPEHIYGLWGSNGAGKTTLIRIITGMLAPDEGSVTVLGKNPLKEWSVRRLIGIVEDGDAFFPELTAEEYLWWVGRLRHFDDDQCEQQLEQLARNLNLSERLESLIGSLSHGMRRKVTIASAFIGQPKLIILDEPTNGLDVDSLAALCDMLTAHRQNGGTAILACHDSAFVTRVCSKVIVLENGTVTKHGSIGDTGFG